LTSLIIPGESLHFGTCRWYGKLNLLNDGREAVVNLVHEYKAAEKEDYPDYVDDV
jgi:hypothetical protein